MSLGGPHHVAQWGIRTVNQFEFIASANIAPVGGEYAHFKLASAAARLVRIHQLIVGLTDGVIEAPLALVRNADSEAATVDATKYWNGTTGSDTPTAGTHVAANGGGTIFGYLPCNSQGPLIIDWKPAFVLPSNTAWSVICQTVNVGMRIMIEYTSQID